METNKKISPTYFIKLNRDELANLKQLICCARDALMDHENEWNKAVSEDDASKFIAAFEELLHD